MNLNDGNGINDAASNNKLLLVEKINSMTKDELNLFISLAIKELGLQLN